VLGDATDVELVLKLLAADVDGDCGGQVVGDVNDIERRPSALEGAE